jgi:hypothetical protein
MRTYGGVSIYSMHSKPRYYMEVSLQLQGSVPFAPEIDHAVPIV